MHNTKRILFSEFDVPLSLLHDKIAHSSLLPKTYAAYTPLIADALQFFLRHLPSARLRLIFAEQLNLSVSVSVAERLVALLTHVPALHKLGQVMARDRRLSPDFRHRLQQLESMTPRTPMPSVIRLLDREFKDWKKSGIILESKPLAEGSVAVIAPFAWHPSQHEVHHGIFKLLKPGVQRELEEDLQVLSLLAVFLDEKCHEYHLPPIDYRDTFRTIKELLLHELQFEEEQRNLAEAAEMYAGINSVVIPALFPFCSAEVTAMERLHGRRIPLGNSTHPDEFQDDSAWLVAQALVAQPLFSPREAALFHADPHAGNLLLMPDHRVGILDWSLTGRLTRADRAAVLHLMLGALSLNVSQMEQAVKQLGHQTTQGSNLFDVLNAQLRPLLLGRLPGITWLIGLLDEFVLSGKMRFKSNLLLFRKSLLTLEGVLADLTRSEETVGHHVLDSALTSAFLKHWMLDWPDRFLPPYDAKSPTTHLSTADILSLACSSSLTFARWWQHVSSGCLRFWQQSLAPAD